MHQLRSDSPLSSELDDSSPSKHLALEGSKENQSPLETSSADLMQTSLNVKHCNSFNSDILESNKSENNNCDTSNENAVARIDKHHSADSDILGMC